MKLPLKIACIGEAMIELSIDDTTPRIGYAGDTLNTAIYMRRALPDDFEVAFVTVLGRDALSDRMVQFIEQQNLSTEGITRHPVRPPGIYAIHTGTDGEREFSYWRENSAARTLFEDGFDRLETFDVIYLSAITLAILPDNVRAGLLNWLSRWDGVFAFDSNYRPRLWEDVKIARAAISEAWKICDIAFPSLDDEIALFGDMDEDAVLRRMRGYGVEQGVLKRGGEGPVPITLDALELPLFPEAPKIVDSTAAGDSFVGTFLAAHLTGASLAQAMLEGHRCAIEVIGQRGAIVPTSQKPKNSVR